MQKMTTIGNLIPLVLALCLSVSAQDQNTKAAIEKKLESDFALTKTTADMTDIVTPGCVLVLRKDNLITVPITIYQNIYHNSYKNGRISQGALGALTKISGQNASGIRTFVSGEKLWVTNISVTEKQISFSLVSDPYNDVRYKASLSFPFQKNITPSPAQIEQTIGEVFTVQPFDSTNGQPQTQPPAPTGRSLPQTTASPQVAPNAPAPIAPPPPPGDAPQTEPKTVSLGQTPNEVAAILGKPDKITKLPNKETYYYKDFKVIFVGGKVSDIQ